MVANTYDNLMTDRPNRPPYQVNQAIKLLKHMSGIYFDPRIVTAVVANIATYPVGSFIKLNTGEIGIVSQNNPENPQRPVIRIVVDAHLRRVKKPYEVDLSQMTTVIPVEVINERELSQLLPRTNSN